MPAIRPHLSLLQRIDSADTRGDVVQLDRNERVSPLSEDVQQEILAGLGPRTRTGLVRVTRVSAAVLDAGDGLVTPSSARSPDRAS